MIWSVCGRIDQGDSFARQGVCDGPEYRNHSADHKRIGRTYSIDLIFESAAERERAGEPHEQTAGDQRQSLPEHQLEDTARRASQSDANADLAGSLGDQVGQHAVNTDR